LPVSENANFLNDGTSSVTSSFIQLPMKSCFIPS
jgi:hypothetical protein